MMAVHETGKGFWTEGLPGLRAQPGGMPENIVMGIDSEHNVIKDGMGTIRAHKSGGSELFVLAHGQANAEIVRDGEPSLTRNHEQPIVAYNIQHNDGGDHKRKDRPNGGLYVNETETALTVGTTDMTAVAYTNRGISTGGNTETLRSSSHGALPLVGVRRLTPTECARLQGFPDDWNDWMSDSARYRQFGNAVAVPCAEWIGRRIVEHEHTTSH